MKVYHLTRAEYAAAIVRRGFRDGTGPFLTARQHNGVWVSDRALGIEAPLKLHKCACFEVDIPEALIKPREWIENERAYREFLIPAAVLNGFPRRLLPLREGQSIVALPSALSAGDERS